jgi:hypothetical protein
MIPLTPDTIDTARHKIGSLCRDGVSANHIDAIRTK